MGQLQRVFRTWIISLIAAVVITVPALTVQGQAVPESSTGAGFFVENVGQFPGEGRFLLSGGQSYIWAAPDGIWVTRLESTQEAAARGEPQGRWKVTGGVNLHLSFKGANPSTQIVPYGALETHVSYLKGTDPADWHADVPVWSGVRYVDLYPGIDLVLETDATGNFSWRLEAKDLAQTHRVQLVVEGADHVQANGSALLIATDLGEYTLPLPRLVQQSSAGALGADSKTTVTAVGSDEYEVTTPFTLAESSLLADNNLQGSEDLLFSTFLGGSGTDKVKGVDVNAAQEIFAAGETLSSDFPVSTGAFDVALNSTDAFVVRLNKDGNGILYATYLGGSSLDEADGIAVAGDTAYIVGSTFSEDFPLAGVKIGEYDAFVAALNATGTDLIYATRHGGSKDDYGYGIDVESGLAYITGTTFSNDIPGASPPAKMRGFAAKFDASGSRLYGVVFGGRSLDAAYAIKVSGGSAFITGESDSFDLGPGGTFIAGVDDTFVIKLGAIGEKVFARMLGGTQFDRGNGITVDAGGRAIIAGSTNSTDLPVTEGANAGDYDAFMAVLNAAGTAWDYVTYLGGAGGESAASVSLDVVGGIQVVGSTTSTNFPVTQDAYQSTIAGGQDAFITRFDLSGTDPGHRNYSAYLGGAASDQAQSIATDVWGYTYLGGFTSSANFPVVGAVDSSLGGSQDGFIAKLAVGPIPGVVLKKYTNGADADLPPGPYILKNGQVTWNYQIYNTGSAPLNAIVLTDNRLTGSISCPTTTLAPGASTTCTITGTAIAGQYSNTGTVVAQPPGGLPIVTDDDLSHYFGAEPKITITATTAGLDGRVILVGQTAAITYLVKNTGNVPLGSVSVNDSAGITVTCPGNTLAASEQFTCNASMPVTAGTITHTATVTANPPGGLPGINASDPTSHFGASPSIALTNKVSVNGGTVWNDSNTGSGLTLLIGNAPKFQLSVNNNGNVALTNIAVPGCSTIASLAVGATSSACTVTGTWATGQQENLKTATGSYTDGLGNVAPLSSADPAYYFGADPKLTINKEISLDSGATWLVTNTGDAPTLLAGFDTPKYRITVKNTGNVALNTTISDSILTLAPSCTPVTLGPNDNLAGGLDEKICIVEKAWASGLRTNTATAAASFTDDGSHNLALNVTYSAKYFGAAPAVSIEKYVSVSNTTPSWQMADSAPGPYLLDGHAVPQYKVTITNNGNVPLTGINVTDSDFALTGCTAPFNLVSGSKDCTATAGWAAGQHENTATLGVTYTDSQGHSKVIEATDKAFYFGAHPSLSVTKDISIDGGSNWHAADTVPGPELLVDSVAPQYKIKVINGGNVPLSTTLTDSSILNLPTGCAPGTLIAGASHECIVTGSWGISQQSNTATASAAYLDNAGNSASLSVNNSAHYFGAQPQLNLEKYVSGDNGVTWQDADTQPGPYFLSSSVLKYKLVLDNTGNVNLSTPTWSDPGFILTSCPLPASFTPEATPVECPLSGTWAAGQIDNLASASAGYTDTAGHLSAPSDTDAAHYFGAQPGVSITKKTNGDDANSTPGPYVLVGDAVTWTYVITNTGNVPLTGIGVSDDNGTPLNSTDDFNVSCSSSSLGAGSGQTCEASSTAIEAQYVNVGTVTAQPKVGDAPIGFALTSSDLSHYFGARISLTLEKTTNGVVTDNTPPGPFVQIGQTVTWAFKVTNTSNIPLTNIQVRDDLGTPSNSADDLVVCTISSLGVGKSNNPTNCKFSRTALAGQYVNVGTATVTVLGKNFSATDKGHYYGYDPNQVLDLTVTVNDQISTNPPGVYILKDNEVTFLYTIYNSSLSTMQISGLVDDNGTPSDAADDVTICQGFTIPSRSTNTCSRTIPAVEGPRTHNGSVTGTISTSTDELTHNAAGSYFGVRPGITLDVHTNGQDPTSALDLPIKAGEVTWEYFIENTSNVDLSGISLVDEHANPIACPFTGLAIGVTMTCTAEGIAQSGANQIPFHVKGVWPDGLQAFYATADSLYFGVVAGVTLDFQVNGLPANTAPGPQLMIGELVNFTYIVTNTGNFPMVDMTVTDTAGNSITCPSTSLISGASTTCTAQETALEGLQFRNATINGSVNGEPVSASDPINYTGVQFEFYVYLPLIIR